jgi:hypothetical protein
MQKLHQGYGHETSLMEADVALIFDVDIDVTRVDNKVRQA